MPLFFQRLLQCLLLLVATGATEAFGQAGNAELSAAFTDSPLGVTLGQYFICTLTINNAGWEIATNTVVTNRLPAGLQFVSMRCSRGVCTQAGGVVTWSPGNFPQYNATATLTLEFKAASAGIYTNLATISSDTPDPDLSNNTATLKTVATPARFFAVGRTHTGYYLPTATVVTSNRVLVVGSPLTLTADLYNTTTRLFESPGNTKGLHSHHTATRLTNGLVLVVGGNYLPYTPEVFDPATFQFRAVGNTYAPRWYHAATLLADGRVLLCGNAYPPLVNEVYSPVTETFSQAPSLNCAPDGTLLPNGKYLTVNWGNATLYDPVTGSTTNTGSPVENRAYHTTTLLPGGKVLIAGGYIYNTPYQSTASAEIYDVATGTFTSTANLTTWRHDHGACALPDGTALICGGLINNSGQGLDRAEIFDLNGTMNVPGVGVSDTSIVEGDTGTNWMQFTISLTTTSAWPVTVDFATAGVTAGTVDYGVANLDFANTNGTLTIPAGQTNAIVSVPIFGDLVREPNELLTLTLSGPTQAWMARATATGTIIDNDPLPTVSIAPATVTELDTGLTNLTFNVSLTAQSLSPVTVDFYSTDGTATAGLDYSVTSGSLTFNPGESVQTINVPVFGEQLVEPDETLTLTLTNVQGALFGISQATGTILNDDGLAGKVHHFDISNIGASQIQTLPFPVSVTAKDAFGNVVTNFAGPLRLAPNNTNTDGANLDFEAPTAAPWVTFNSTGLERNFRRTNYDVAGDGKLSTAFVTVVGGGTNGIAQNVYLTGGVPYTFKANLMAVKEYYDMACLGGTAYLEIGPTNGTWGLPGLCGGSARGAINFTYTPPTNGLYPLRLTFELGYYYGDAYYVYADDIQILFPQLTPTVATNGFTNGVWAGAIAALQSAGNVTLLATDGDGHKGLSNPFGVQALADPGLTVTAAVQGTPPLRTGMKQQFNLALTNRGPSAIADAVVACPLPPNLTFISATNNQGVITNNAGLLTWTPGLLPKGSNFTAVVVCRADIPGDFTNQFNLSTVVLDLNPADNAVAISNHIDPPLLVISDATGVEGAASITGMVFTVTLSGPSAQTITVDYRTVDGTATNNLDFVSTNGTVTFPPGTTNATIRVYPIDDILAEPTRYFAVVLTNAVNAIISDDTGVGTLNDDDPVPVISIADTSVVEGDSGTTNAVFQLTLSKPAITTVTVRCTTSNGTAGTNDFVSTVTTVSFPAGVTNATFTVPVRGNTVNEPDETFTVTLSLPTNATIGRGTATGTILNDDLVPGRLDHFVWDPIATPRYKDWAFPVVLRAVDYLGNTATNGITSTLVSARTENGLVERLSDDFEDGDSVGWTNYITTFTVSVTNETAATGQKSLRLTGATANTTAGLRRTFTNGTPNKISFAVRASRTNQVAGRFTAYGSSIYRSAVFYFNNNGQMGMLDRQLGFRGVPYQSNRWYQVALTMNFGTQKADCRIDGALVLTNITFPDSVNYVDGVVLANQDNTTSWWDDIRVYNDNVTNVFSITPSNFVAFVNGAKTNLVTIAGAATNTWLTADDALDHVGNSGYFELVTAGLILTTPASATEGVGTVTASVGVPVPFPQPITVTLTSTVPSELTVPASVVIPANQTNVSFNLTIIDDALLDGAQLVPIIARATNYISTTNIVSVEDNESAVLTLTIPATAIESAGTLVGQGQVVSSAPPTKSATVTLTSSDTNVVQVPPTVLIQSNQTVANFNLVIVDNQRLDGPHSAIITASVVSWTGDSKTITVSDDETASLRLTGPAQVNEGSGPVAFTAWLGGTLTTNLTLTLGSSQTNALTLPATVDVPAGQISVVVPVTAPDNSLFEGTKLVTLSASAAGFGSATTNVNVTDNDVHHFNFSSIASPQQGSVAFSLTLTARDTNNVLMSWYATNIALSARDGLNNPVPITPASVILTNGQWTGNITATSWEFQNVRLTATDPGGQSSQSSAFDVNGPTVMLTSVNAQDLVYSEFTHQIYAVYTNAGTITPIEPFFATVGTPVAVASLAGKLCIADGGQYVFASMNSTNHIGQFDVNLQSLVNAWTLGGMTVEDMTPVVGSPAAVAVSRRNGNGSPHFGGVAIYDNGVARSNVYTAFLGANVIEPSGTPGMLFGYDNESSPAQTQILKYDAGGIYLAGSWGGLQGFNVDIACRAGQIFATTGQIFDPLRNQQIGTFTGTLPVAEDVPSGRFYIVSSGAVTAYDVKTLLPVGATTTGLSPTTGTTCIRWGANGLAFRSSSRVALVRTPLIASGLPANVVLSVANASGPFAAGSNYTYTLTVSNAGPNIARGVVIASTISANAQFIAAVPSAGAATQAAGGLVCSLQNISNGAVASVNITLKPLKPGLLTSMASVTGDSPDPNLTNNAALVNTPVSSAPAPDSVVELALNTTDLTYEPHANRLFVSVPNSDRWLGNNLVSLNPSNGLFDAPVPTALDPGKLAVSGDGQFLYAGLNSEASIQRVNLATRAVDLKFPTGLGGVADMAVLPGNAQAVAVTAYSTLAVYDNGVMRSNTVGPGPYNYSYNLAFSATNALAYEGMPTELRRIGIDSSGATLLDSSGLINNYDREIKFDAGLLYTAGGRVIDPEAHGVVTNLPYSGLACPDSPGSKVFYLTVSGSIGTLHALQASNFFEVGAVIITNISGTVSGLQRWGTDGLAFRTTGGQVFLVRTTMADDRDNDGLADLWEQLYFPSYNSPNSAAGDDPDGDGMTNLQEWPAGLNPVVYDAVRFLGQQRLAGGGFQLIALGRLSQNYALFASTNLKDWTPILNFVCTNLPTVLVDSAAPNFSQRFYRLEPQSTIPQPSLAFGAQPLGTNGVNLILLGFAGISYQLQTSTNLINWISVTNFTSTNSLMPLRDASATNVRSRFYRVIIP